MSRISIVFLVLLVWTTLSISSANDDINDDGLDDYVMDDESDDVDDYVDAVLDDEDTFEPSSEEGKKCLLQLISDCMTENEGNSEACESLATNLEVSFKSILKKPLLIQCIFRMPPPRGIISRISAMFLGMPRLPLPVIRRPRRTLTRSRADSTKFLIN